MCHIHKAVKDASSSGSSRSPDKIMSNSTSVLGNETLIIPFGSENSSAENYAVDVPSQRRAHITRSSSESSCSCYGYQSDGGSEQEWDEGTDVHIGGPCPKIEKVCNAKDAARRVKSAAKENRPQEGKNFKVCHCGYMQRGHICALATGSADYGGGELVGISAPAIDNGGLICFNDSLSKKVHDVIKNFSTLEEPICLYNIYNRINQNNIQNGVLRKRRNLKPILKIISDLLSSGAIIHKSSSGGSSVSENGYFSVNPEYDSSCNADIKGDISKRRHEANISCRRRVIEQFDKISGKALRRYRCMADACAAMGVPGHYLTYKVFGSGAKSHKCVFGWRELITSEPEIVTFTALPGESYADLEALKSYLRRYLGKPAESIPAWTEFVETYDPADEHQPDEGDRRASPSSIKSFSKVRRSFDIPENIQSGTNLPKNIKSKKASAQKAINKLMATSGCNKESEGIKHKKMRSLADMRERLQLIPELKFSIPEELKLTEPLLTVPVEFSAKRKRKISDEYASRKKAAVGSGTGPRLTEQFDKATGQLLRRYRCMTDACVAMGQPTHYLSYKIFGSGARFHSCVFGWREVRSDDASSVPEELYADVVAMRSYMKRFLGAAGEIPTWESFLETYVPPEVETEAAAITLHPNTSATFGRRVMEQYDRVTNKVLRRYHSMTDASIALGQPAHYLAYKVFGKGARAHACVFGWTELPADSSVNPQEGEEYADLDHLRLYMLTYLDKSPHLVKTWTEFEDTFNENFPKGSFEHMLASFDEIPKSNLTVPEIGGTEEANECDERAVNRDCYAIEQYDLDTNCILRRYRSQLEACKSIGQPPHYLYRSVFKSALDVEGSCIFGWRKIHYVDDSTIEPRCGENYVDISLLKLFMDKFSKKSSEKRPSWLKFWKRQGDKAASCNEVFSESIDPEAWAVDCSITAAIPKKVVPDCTSRKNFYLTSSRAVEQWDLQTKTVLRRYNSLSEACAALGQPLHYLGYKVFGKGSRWHQCVFGWTELQGAASVLPKTGEIYESIDALKSYMQMYLYQPAGSIPSWREFKDEWKDTKCSFDAVSNCPLVPAKFEIADRSELIVAALQAISEKGAIAKIDVIEREIARMVYEDDSRQNTAHILDELVREGVIIKSFIPDDNILKAVVDDESRIVYKINDHYRVDFENIPVLCLNSTCSIALMEFLNVKQASEVLGISTQNIFRVCTRLQEKSCNLCFRWMDAHASEYPTVDKPLDLREIKSMYMIEEEDLIGVNSRKKNGIHGSNNTDSPQHGDYFNIRRPRYPDELVRYIGRRFKKIADDNYELFTVTHVCLCKHCSPTDFYFRYYSNRMHPLKKPTDENSFQYILVNDTLSDDADIEWVPVGAHISVSSMMDNKLTSNRRTYRKSVDSEQQKRDSSNEHSDEDSTGENRFDVARTQYRSQISSFKKSCKKEFIKFAQVRIYEIIREINNKSLDSSLNSIQNYLGDDLLITLEEHNIMCFRVVRQLLNKGAIEVGDNGYFVNVHYNINYESTGVLCLSPECSVALHHFSNVNEASAKLGISVDSILKVCRRQQKSTSNLCFRWIDHYVSEYPVLTDPLSIEKIKSEYVCRKQGRQLPAITEARRTNRTRKPAIDNGTFHCTPNVGDKFVPVKRRCLNETVLSFLGRKFRIPNIDDVFVTCNVCSTRDDQYLLFYKYFSLSKFPKDEPVEESDHFFAECDNMIDSHQFAQWLPEDFDVESNGNQSIRFEESSSDAGTDDKALNSEVESQDDECRLSKRRRPRPVSVVGSLLLGLIKKWKQGEPQLTLQKLRARLSDSGVKVDDREIAMTLRRLIASGKILHENNGDTIKHATSKDIERSVTSSFRPNSLYREEGSPVPVYCYTVKGLFIKLFSSVEAASEYLQLEEKDIRGCCMDRIVQLGGLKFRWASDEEIALYMPGAGKSTGGDSDYRNIAESKSAVGDRLRRRLLYLAKEMSDNGEDVSVDTLYRRILPEFERKGVLPAYVDDVINIQVRKGHMLVDKDRMEGREDDEALYMINPSYRSDYESYPIMCLTVDNVPLRVFQSIAEAEKQLSVESLAIFNVLLKVKLKSTRNLKFIWLDEATSAEIEEANNNSEDISEYIRAVGANSRTSNENCSLVSRRTTSRFRQFSSVLNDSFHVPERISEVFKEHEVLASRVKRSLDTSTFDDLKPPKAPRLTKPGAKRGRPRKKVVEEQVTSESEENDEEFDTGIDAYHERHNAKGKAMDAIVPDYVNSSHAESSDVVSQNESLIYSRSHLGQLVATVNSFLFELKRRIFTPGKVLKARIPGCFKTDDSYHGRCRNEIHVVCSIGDLFSDDEHFAQPDSRKISVFDGHKVHNIDVDYCLLENEDEYINILWRSAAMYNNVKKESDTDTSSVFRHNSADSYSVMNDANSGAEEDITMKISPAECTNSPSERIDLSIVEIALEMSKDMASKLFYNQWSYQEILELINILKLNPGEPDLCGKHWQTRASHTTRSRKEIVSLYYSMFCPLNRIQSYSQLRNVFSCAEFFKAYYSETDTRDWLLRSSYLTCHRDLFDSVPVDTSNQILISVETPNCVGAVVEDTSEGLFDSQVAQFEPQKYSANVETPPELIICDNDDSNSGRSPEIDMAVPAHKENNFRY